MNNNKKASLGGGVYISYGCIVLMQPSALPNPLESDLNYLHQSYNFPPNRRIGGGPSSEVGAKVGWGDYSLSYIVRTYL